MLHKILLFVALLCACGMPVFGDSDGPREEDPGRMFARAFRKSLSPDERIAIMRSIARDHAESRWGDDALWILAQVAALHRDTARTILLRQQLLARVEKVSLEQFTRSRPIYRRSRLPEVEYLLEQSGHLYSGKPGRATRVNVLPLVLREELGKAYQKLGMYRSAAREYGLAHKLAPAGGFLARIYARRSEKLREKATAGQGDELRDRYRPARPESTKGSESPGERKATRGENHREE